MPDPKRSIADMVNFDTSSRESLRIAFDAEVTSGKDDTDTMTWEWEQAQYTLLIAYVRHLLPKLDETLGRARTWMSPVPDVCDIAQQHKITDTFYDARLATGTAWANMCPACWETFGTGVLGTGFGQRYQRRADGVFVKTGG